MENAAAQLDAEELLHVALTASQEGQHDHAIRCLKQALDISPENAKVHYFLGAEHAQIGLYDRAVQELAHAVQLDPSLHTAHFQLGLLQMSSGHPNDAAESWAPLDSLGDDHPLRLFKSGLLALSVDDFEACRERLSRGIQLNSFSDALNKDMQGILEKIANRSNTTPDNVDAQRGDEKHVLLSGYTKSGLT